MSPLAHTRNRNPRVCGITECTWCASRELRTLGDTNIKKGVEEEGSMKRTEEEWAERSLSESEKCDIINAMAVESFKILVMN